MPPKSNKPTAAEIAAAIDQLARSSTSPARAKTAAAPAKKTVTFRFPNPLLSAAIFFGMFVTIALAAHHNSSWSAYAFVAKLCYWHPALAHVLNWVDANVASYVFFGHQGIALAFIAPAAVFAHVGEAIVAWRRLVALRVSRGVAACSGAMLVAHTASVVAHGFPALAIVAQEIANVSR